MGNEIVQILVEQKIKTQHDKKQNKYAFGLRRNEMDSHILTR